MTSSTEESLGLIRVLSGEYRSAEIRLKPGEMIKIGRAVDNDLILENQKSVSRNHLAITWYAEDNAFGVLDTSSSGTRREDTEEFLPKNDGDFRISPGVVLSIGGVENQIFLSATGTEENTDDESWAWLYPGMVIDGRYAVKKMIAKGKGSVTYQCMDKTLGVPVAIKSFADDEKAGIEAKNLAQFRNANDIVNVYGVIDSGDKSYVVMEYTGWRSLGDCLKKGDIGNPGLKRKIIDKTLMAVRKLHSEGVSQGFLSPDSIFISGDADELEVKIYIESDESVDGISIDMSVDEIRDRLYIQLIDNKYLKKKKRNRVLALVTVICVLLGASITIPFVLLKSNPLFSERLESADFASDPIEIWVSSENEKAVLENVIENEFIKPADGAEKEVVDIINDNNCLDNNDFSIRISSSIPGSIDHAMDGNGKMPDMFISDEVNRLSQYSDKLISLKETVYSALNPNEYFHLSEEEYDRHFNGGYEIPTRLESNGEEVDGYKNVYCVVDNGDEKRILACERLLWTLLGKSAQMGGELCPIHRGAMDELNKEGCFVDEKNWLDEHEGEMLLTK